jgi:PDZ domain-containing protein
MVQDLVDTLQAHPASGPAQDAGGPRRLDDLIPRWLQVGLVLSAILGLAGSLVHIPFHSVGSGDPVDVLDRIDVRGTRTFPARGKLLLTTASVSTSTLTVWEGLRVWLDPGEGTIPRDALYPPNEDPSDADLQNEIAIKESKVVGAVAAFRALGRTVSPDGARVIDTVKGAPADGVLRAGDRILRIDGVRLRTKELVIDAIGTSDVRGMMRTYVRVRRLRARLLGWLGGGGGAAARATIERSLGEIRTALLSALPVRRAGDPISVTIERRSRTRTFDLRMGKDPGGSDRSLLGVLLIASYDLPNDISIDTDRIVGPSAGLVFALGVVEVFTRQDLTRGRVIGVTGTIAASGAVGPIGAPDHKVRGALSEGATVFLVPKEEEAEARAAAPPSMTVIGVSTLSEAIQALRALKN